MKRENTKAFMSWIKLECIRAKSKDEISSDLVVLYFLERPFNIRPL
nr:hypothetical protein [Clostridium massiliamazoniense]